MKHYSQYISLSCTHTDTTPDYSPNHSIHLLLATKLALVGTQ